QVPPLGRRARGAGGVALPGAAPVVQARRRRSWLRGAGCRGPGHDARVRRDVGVVRVSERPLPRPAGLAAAASRPGARVTSWMVTAALALPVLLVVAELGCRRWTRRRMRYAVWPPGLRLEVRQDPRVFPEVEPRVRFHVNADVERGDEVRGDEAGLYRILVAGGSSVECFALDQPTSWPGALERLLNAPESLHALGARQVHAGNIGRSGVGSAELDLILECVLAQYRRLDAIRLMVGASDVY